MPRLLNSGVALAGTTGTSTIFLTLEGAQPSLGLTPSTSTGYTLVTGPNGQLGWTSTLGSILFNNSVMHSTIPNGDLTIMSTGTGALNLNGRVLINGQEVNAGAAAFNTMTAILATITDLTVTGRAIFTSATNTATFAGDVRVENDFRVDQQLDAYGNVTFAVDNGIIDIRPTGVGTINIRPSGVGQMNNVIIGNVTPVSGVFTTLTATNIQITSTATIKNAVVTGTAQVSVANITTLTATYATITNTLYATEIYDSGTRVISQVIAGEGLSGGGNGPVVALTNTGVLSLTAGTDTVVNSTTGNITIWNTSTFQSITDRGNSTTNQIIIENATSATSTTTGALVIKGGVGIGGDLHVNGSFYANGQAVLTTATIGGNLNSGTDITVTINTNTGIVTIDNTSTLQTVTSRGSTTTYAITVLNTTASTSTETGALTVSGGIGVGENIHAGGSIYSAEGIAEYNYLLYTPRVTVSTSTPVNSRIGDFWIDPSIGVEYQYVPNGTGTVWIQFTGF